MDSTALRKILAAYGIAGAQFLGVQKGYRNSSHHLVTDRGEHLNLIIYKNEPDIVARIRRTNQVGDILAAQRFPARQTYDARILELKNGITARYAALYVYLPGTTIPWEAYTMRHLKQLGKTMGDMHRLLQGASSPELPAVTDEYLAIVRRMERYFSQAGVQHAMQAKLHVAVDHTFPARATHILEQCSALPGQQPLHMDFVRGNILFTETPDGPQVSGVLDLEKTAHGHPLFDLARTYAFLLVDCKYKPEAKIRKYFLQSGYNRHSSSPFRITTPTAALLEQLTSIFLLYDFYKFLRHNPYESLPQNEHYMRTKQILINRNIIHPA